MGKCLITKLNGTVNNTNLLKVGEIRIHIKKVDSPTTASQTLGLSFAKDATLTIIGDGYFTDKTLTENKGKTLTTPFTSVFVSNGDFDIAMQSKYDCTRITPYYAGQVEAHITYNKIINIDDLKYSINLTTLYMNGKGTTGNLSSLSNLTNLTSIGLSNTSVTGNIESLKDLKLLSELNLSDTNIMGNLSSISSLTNLKQLYLFNLSGSTLTGDISALKNMVNLTGLNLSGSTLTGDISALKNMVNLTNVSFLKSTLTGNLSTIPAKCSLISASPTSNFTWTNRDSTAKILSIIGNPTIANIDKMLQDQAACVASTSGGKIEVIGARTSASDDAVQTLQNKGYTISVTPA